MEWADGLVSYNSAGADFVKAVETVSGINNFQKQKFREWKYWSNIKIQVTEIT